MGLVRGSVLGIAPGVEDQVRVAVEADQEIEVLGHHQVADGLGLWLGEGSRTPIDKRAGVGAGAPPAPLIAVVAVEVHAIGVGRVATHAPVVIVGVLAPVLAALSLDVAVGIGHGHDPDLPLIQQPGHLRVHPVVVDQNLDEIHGDLGGDELAGVVLGHDEELGLWARHRLAGDPHGPQVPVGPALDLLPAIPHVKEGGELRVVGGRGQQEILHLHVGTIAGGVGHGAIRAHCILGKRLHREASGPQLIVLRPGDPGHHVVGVHLPDVQPLAGPGVDLGSILVGDVDQPASEGRRGGVRCGGCAVGGPRAERRSGQQEKHHHPHAKQTGYSPVPHTILFANM